MFERLFGVSGATHAGLDMISCPAKCGIAHLNVQGDAADGGEYERAALMVNAPFAIRPRRTRLALQKEFYDVAFICLEHFSPLLEQDLFRESHLLLAQ
jgi:hypothetical protein